MRKVFGVLDERGVARRTCRAGFSPGRLALDDPRRDENLLGEKCAVLPMLDQEGGGAPADADPVLAIAVDGLPLSIFILRQG